MVANRIRPIEFPKYLDVLLLLQDNDNRLRVNKVLDRSEPYIVKALSYLESVGCIYFSDDVKDNRKVIISLTDKGRDVKRLVLALCNCIGIKVTYGWMD